MVASARSRLPWWRDPDDVRESVIGELTAASGALVACDPLCFLDGAKPFARTVRPGRYAVVIGHLDRDVAYARIDFGAGPAQAWEPALCEGEVAPRKLRDTPGFPVDAGTACFVDVIAQRALVAEDEAWGEEVRRRVGAKGLAEDSAGWREAYDAIRGERPDLLERLRRTGYLTDKSEAVLSLDDERGNLIAFSSGAGDGVYSSFWGLDAAGVPVCLLTDFGLLDRDEDASDAGATDAGSDAGAADEAVDDDSDADDSDGSDSDGDRAPSSDSAEETRARAARQPPPLMVLAKRLVATLEDDGLLELTDEEDARSSLVEDLADFLGSLVGERDAGERITAWLTDHDSVGDVFGDDLTLVGTVRRALSGDDRSKKR